MTISDKRINKGLTAAKQVIQKRNDLIADGYYPKSFSYPVSIQFEVTSKCNLSCLHCYNKSSHKNIDAISPKMWVNICKNIVQDGGIFQSTISGGEPLLLGNDLWEIMDVLHNDGTFFNFISNGYLFNSKVIESLKKYNFYWVQISIDNPIPEKHDAFRQKNGSWIRAAKAAYTTALAGIPVRIATTITKECLGKLEDIVKMSINLGASFLVIGEIMPSGRAFDNKDLLLTNHERDQFYLEMDSLMTKYKDKISILPSGSQRVQLEFSSSGKIDGVIIRPNGDVRLDCTCPFVIGNILESNLKEIWMAKQDAWSNNLVKEYISSCDFYSGISSMIDNYVDNDIRI